MVIVPVLHRVLVKPDKLEDIDETVKRAKAVGITIEFSNEAKREQMSVDTGIIVDFGPTVFRDFGSENTLVKGDRVVYAKYGGKAVTHPQTKEDYVLLNDEDIIAIFKETE